MSSTGTAKRAEYGKNPMVNNQFLGAGFDKAVGCLLPEILSHPSADVAFLSFFALAYSLTSFVSRRHADDYHQGLIFGLAGSSVVLISFMTNADNHFIILSYIPKAVFLSMAVSLGCRRLWRRMAQS
ncbi:hypothetical protein F503_00551 [Ophiostoma piceae UAMH 11346]|uniref:Uncharacterized protein n=1 Tax=Ophiostoma piceae (strain UAMH 11346) TaxID=1262450 RepID=S3C2T0_OPHP1|nr:hypothetical protein F503_00551 [Ophiostoma piceae UAMH 11346]